MVDLTIGKLRASVVNTNLPIDYVWKKIKPMLSDAKKCYPTVANGNQVIAEGIFVLADDEQSLADAKWFVHQSVDQLTKF